MIGWATGVGAWTILSPYICIYTPTPGGIDFSICSSSSYTVPFGFLLPRSAFCSGSRSFGHQIRSDLGNMAAADVLVVEELEPEKSAALKRRRIDLVEGVEHEKAASVEGVEQEKAAVSSDSDSEDSDDDMDDELRRYNEQIDKSDGFDVDFVISKRFWTAIYPIHLLEDGHQKYDGMIDTSAKFAIKYYNEQHQDHEKLELIKVVRANVMIVAGYFFFITLKAKNIATSEEKTYQTRVDYKFGHEEYFEVPIFRLPLCKVPIFLDRETGESVA